MGPKKHPSSISTLLQGPGNKVQKEGLTNKEHNIIFRLEELIKT